MPLLNRTKKIVIENKVKVASDFFSQLKGLMFEAKKNFDYALVFPLSVEGRFSASIHCLFVFFPIDVVYLDKDKKVIDIIKNVKPFTFFKMPKKKAKYFIELRAGKSSGIETGHEIEW